MRLGAVALLALGLAGCKGGGERESRPGARVTAAPAARSAHPVEAAPAPDESAPKTPARQPGTTLTERTWHYDETPFGPSEVVVAVPEGADREHPLPVLVAFHGRGESLRGPSAGARGWLDDYHLTTAVRRLHASPLTETDLLGFVTGTRLAALNASLRIAPYHGLIVVCPYLPDVLRGPAALRDGEALAKFVVDVLLPRVFRETPAKGTPESTAIDGVSLGGRASLLVGLLRPAAFHVVGAEQPALDSAEIGLFAGLVANARKQRPSLVLRLLTSSDDYFLESTQAFSRELTARSLGHQLDVVSGPHSYDFNRGPGVYEMLLFHDRLLSGAAPIPQSLP